MSKTTTTGQRFLRTVLPFALCTLLASAAPPANQGNLRVISKLPGYSQPGGLIEGSPGVFYSVAQPAGTAVDPSGASVTINQAFPLSCNPPQNFSYSGYFVNPLRDTYPAGGNVQFPGGRVAVTSNNGMGGIVWGLTTVSVMVNGNPGNEGTLLAYDASTLTLLWCSNSFSYMSGICDNSSSFSMLNPVLPFSGPTNSIFAQPTVVNGYVYIPTWGINTSGAQPPNCTNPPTQCTSGVAVYSGH